jgi:lysyl-tRNA synthetase class 2
VSDDFRPTANWNTLKQRAKIVKAIRAFFDERGYTEVQTPLLSHDIVVDAHLEPFVVESEYGRLFLQTSPEFAMKRLLADGADAIYQICHSFRRGEVSPLHNPEFAMLEWYRVGDSYHDQMTFTEQLVRSVLRDSQTFAEEPFQRISYDDAFERATGTKVLQLSADELSSLAESNSVSRPESLNRTNCDELLNVLLANLVEPTLGQTTPEFLIDYPPTQSALARVRNDDPPVAERFELYFHGMELCNGYQELTDADELTRRNAVQNTIRESEGLEPLPTDSRLLHAMRTGLPESSGVALGLDRLIAIALGFDRIDAVWAFPINRA